MILPVVLCAKLLLPHLLLCRAQSAAPKPSPDAVPVSSLGAAKQGHVKTMNSRPIHYALHIRRPKTSSLELLKLFSAVPATLGPKFWAVWQRPWPMFSINFYFAHVIKIRVKTWAGDLELLRVSYPSTLGVCSFKIRVYGAENCRRPTFCCCCKQKALLQEALCCNFRILLSYIIPYHQISEFHGLCTLLAGVDPNLYRLSSKAGTLKLAPEMMPLPVIRRMSKVTMSAIPVLSTYNHVFSEPSSSGRNCQ